MVMDILSLLVYEKSGRTALWCMGGVVSSEHYGGSSTCGHKVTR